jgi:CRP/FNR family transcriptional regulator, cyclic AMP receptor protein
MATIALSRTSLEDPLMHLPCSSIMEHEKGECIYRQNDPATGIFLVIQGKIRVSRLAEDGHQIMLDIYQTDDFFGESALLNLSGRPDQATAMERCRLMAWTTAEIESILTRRPRLAVALLQILVQRTIEFSHRIESFSLDNIERRLARALVRFTERLGVPADDGSVHMVPLTHDLLAPYVGTSREIVTHYMNRFRRQGCLRYSRKGITLDIEGFKDKSRLNRREMSPASGQGVAQVSE